MTRRRISRTQRSESTNDNGDGKYARNEIANIRVKFIETGDKKRRISRVEVRRDGGNAQIIITKHTSTATIASPFHLGRGRNPSSAERYRYFHQTQSKGANKRKQLRFTLGSRVGRDGGSANKQLARCRNCEIYRSFH